MSVPMRRDVLTTYIQLFIPFVLNSTLSTLEICIQMKVAKAVVCRQPPFKGREIERTMDDEFGGLPSF